MPGASTRSTCPGSAVPASDAFSPATRLSSTSVVFPEPDTPVTQVRRPFGMRASSGCTVWMVSVSSVMAFVEKMLGRDGRAHAHFRRACQKWPDAAGRVRFHLGHRPLGDDAAAVGARAGTDLDVAVGGVAVGQKIVHDPEQPLDVRRMQPDGRLVQYVEDAGRWLRTAQHAGAFQSVSLARSRVRYPSPSCSSLWMGSVISLVMESHIGRISGGSHGATPGSHLRSSSSESAVTWARLHPSMVDARADSRVPWQSGHTDCTGTSPRAPCPSRPSPSLARFSRCSRRCSR